MRRLLNILLILAPCLVTAATLDIRQEDVSGRSVGVVNDNFRRIESDKMDATSRSNPASGIYVKSINDGPVSGFRNRIINGDMRIDQRNGGGAVTINSGTPVFGVDRMKFYGQATDGVYTAQQSATAPDGFRYSTKVTVTTADASIGAAQFYILQYNIEGYDIADAGFGTSWAKPVTVSFYVRSSVTGTFGGSLVNSAGDRSYPFSYTISAADTWERQVVTVTADTTGTWLTTTGIGVALRLDFGSGSSFVGTAGAWVGSNVIAPSGSTSLISTVDATWYITGVQLELGPVATAFEHRPFSAEISLCERYYEKSYQYGTVPGTAANLGQELYRRVAAGETQTLFAGVFKTRKRATPTITWYSTSSGTSGRIFNTASGDVVVTGTTGVNERATGSADHGANGLAANIIIAQWVADAEL